MPAVYIGTSPNLAVYPTKTNTKAILIQNGSRVAATLTRLSYCNCAWPALPSEILKSRMPMKTNTRLIEQTKMYFQVASIEPALRRWKTNADALKVVISTKIQVTAMCDDRKAAESAITNRTIAP